MPFSILSPARRRPPLLSLLIFLIAGCGTNEGRVSVYPTSGKVTFQGLPLANARVVFVPAKEGANHPQPSGRTGEDGTFRLMTFDPEDGAPEGDYRVKISSKIDAGESNPLAKVTSNADVLKSRYESSQSSGLTATIKPGRNDVPTFDLK